MAEAQTEPDLIEVRIIGLPLEVQLRAQQHHEGLMREFALITHPHPDSDHDAAGRLLRIIGELRGRYGAFTAGPNAQIEQARERGDESVDLTFRIPPAVRDAALEVSRLLDEVDEYCRRGDLLTLATPDDLVAYRRWYLGEFVAQIDGAPPTPWAA